MATMYRNYYPIHVSKCSIQRLFLAWEELETMQ